MSLVHSILTGGTIYDKEIDSSKSLQVSKIFKLFRISNHGLRTPNEGINQSYLKNWAYVADKIALAVPKNLGLGLNFPLCSLLSVLVMNSHF